MTARDIGKTAPRGREASLLDLALVSNSGISLPYPRYIRKATALACPSQVRATSPVKRPRLWGSGVRAPVALICQYIDRHKERFEAWPICRVLSDSGTKIAPATALHHTTGHYPPGRSRDHPRSRGVYACLGSELAPVVRIIPARAGFTLRPAETPDRRADHPRSRGVYAASARDACSSAGSSPLARGLRGQRVTEHQLRGIIPARAGFTIVVVVGEFVAKDHPRSRGVYLASSGSPSALTGSSPLARGLQRYVLGASESAWIIPARAGFTAPGYRILVSAEDHPRSRGVYPTREQSGRTSRGSSPLARGLPGTRGLSRVCCRIIPARAGFTRAASRPASRRPDHPRSRGVYSSDVNHPLFGLGSSPLARGLRRGTACPRRGWRIIPARAGFTQVVRREDFRHPDHPRSRGVYRGERAVGHL